MRIEIKHMILFSPLLEGIAALPTLTVPGILTPKQGYPGTGTRRGLVMIEEEALSARIVAA